MLSAELNKRLTGVGPGTPGGEMLRRYWHPVAATVQLDENPIKKVRLLGEDLILYRDESGNLGLIDEPCPHRRISMEYGMLEDVGIRCPYHGWLFDHTGACLEQPGEPWDSTYKERTPTKAYPVQDFAGLIFAYLGPAPTPLLPRYDVYVAPNTIRQIGAVMLPCNWLQCMENSLDPVHVEWLHGHFTDYTRRNEGKPVRSEPRPRHAKIGFSRFEHGILKRRVWEGGTEDGPGWVNGHPIVFPNMLRQGAGGVSGYYNFQIRVPVDDTHTWHIFYMAYLPGTEVPPQEKVPYFDVPLYEEDGKLIANYLDGQDMMAWVTQGGVADREREKLGESDIGIIMYRDMLREQIEKVERGEEPMEVYRDPAQNERIDLPNEAQDQVKFYPGYKLRAGHMRFSPFFQDVAESYRRTEAHLQQGGSMLPRPTSSPVIPYKGGRPAAWDRESTILPKELWRLPASKNRADPED